MAAPFRPAVCLLYIDELPPSLSAAVDMPGGAGPEDQEFPSILIKENSNHQKSRKSTVTKKTFQ